MKRIVFALGILLWSIGPASAQSIFAGSSALATTPDLPDVAECRGLLTQEIIDLVRSRTGDPLEDFEKWRVEHRSMMEASPGIECQSKLWRALNRGPGLNNSATVPPGTEGLSLQPPDNASEMFLRSLTVRPSSASIGANVDPANGVENYQGEMQIAVNPNNPQQLVAGANHFYADPNCLRPGGGATNGTQALYGSTDGGATWTYRCAPWPADINGTITAPVYFFGSDPALAWDSQGRAYVAYMLLNCNSAQTSCGYSIVVARTSNAGSSWQSFGTVVNHSGDSSHGDDKEMIAVDNSPGPASAKSHPGRIYVIWDDNNVERIAYSDDGAAWTTVILPSSTSAIGGNVVVGADGTVYIIWNRLVGNPQTAENILFSKSVDGGNTWSAPITIASPALLSFGTNNKPPAQESRGLNSFGSIALDSNPASPFFGYLYVVYNDFPTGTTSGTNIDTKLIVSTNGGISWSSPLKVNDDAGTATQFFPWASVDQSDGTLHVSWYDTRLDPTNNRKTQVFYARSINGGVSFEPNILVTDNGGVVWRNGVNYSDENTTDNSSRNGNQYGDYSGIVAANRQVHPFWMDSRNFFPLADTVSPTRREDAASATIIHCSAPSAVTALSATPNGSCATPSVDVSWSAPSSWGTNATGGTYSVYRSTTAVFPGGSPLASGLSSTSYNDSTGLPGFTYYYFVVAKNNCPGTTLTPMSGSAAASSAVVFPPCGATFGTLQGTITSAGNPLSGVSVTTGAYSTTTNGSGFYQFSPIVTGSHNVTASKSGYNSSTINGVVVTNGGTTVQNFSLTPVTTSACFTDTTQSDFDAGTKTNVDVSVSPGDVKLAVSGAEALDQSNDANCASCPVFSTTTWLGQSFKPGASGKLTRVDVKLFCTTCSSGAVVQIRSSSAGLPATLLATATITGIGGTNYYTATFASPATLTSGTTYHITLHTSGAGTYAWHQANGNNYANGNQQTSSNSGGSWSVDSGSGDYAFKTYMTPATYTTSGNLISSVKDSNSVLGSSPTWTTLSWTSTIPANTTVRFQAAGSNNSGGPFSFVGPDGTASTFFTTSGASLAQFNGNRYLKYKAYLSTTDPAMTPTLSDVTVCYQLADCSSAAPAITPAPAQVCASSTGNTASGAAGMTSYAWGITNGTITGGASTQTVTYTAGASGNTTLTLTITNASACTAASSIDVPITANPAAPTITAGGPTTFCTGGSVTLSSSSATGNQWYLNGSPIGSATNDTYVATASGSYTVRVTSGSCTSAASNAIVVTVNAPPSVTITGPTTYCNGAAAITLDAGAGFTSYLWSPGGATTRTINVSPSSNTTYSVTVSNGSCNANDTHDVTVATPPTVTITGPTTYCTGAAAITLDAGAGFTSYLWSPGGATTQTINVSPSSNTTYTVTVSNGTCSASDTQDVTVATPPTVTITGPTSYCTGAAAVTLDAGAGFVSYLWSPGGVTTQTINVSPSSNTTYSVTVSNGTCSASDTHDVTVATPPTVTITGPTTYCTGAAAITLDAGAGFTSYLWAPGGATTQTINVSPSSNTTYSVTVSNGTCSSSDTHDVTVATPPTVTITGPTTYCTGAAAITLDAGVGFTSYLWSPGGATTQTINVSPSSNATYSVTVSNGTCSASDTHDVTVSAPPSVTIAGPTTYCTGTPAIMLDAGAGFTSYLWSPGGATTQTINVSPSSNTTYSVTVSNGTCSASDTHDVTVATPPTVTITGPTTYCTGSPAVTLDAGAGFVSYLWSPGGATTQTINVSPSSNTTYTVTVSNGTCSASDTHDVTVATPPTVTITGPTNYCTGSPAITLDAGAGFTSYLWSPGGATTQTINVSPSSNTTYSVTVSNGSCNANDTHDVTVATPPTVTITGPTSYCTGSPAITLDGGAGFTSYLWSPGGATTQTINVSPSSNTTYTVTVSNGTCSASDTHDVTVSAPPSVTITGPTTYCTGAAAITLDAGVGFTSYLWSPGGATTQTINVSPSSNATYTVTVSNGTCSASDTHDVTVATPPTVTITGPTSYCTGSPAITLDAGAGFTSYLWSPGGATSQTINVSPSSNTTYTVTVSNGSCSATDTHDVTVATPPTVTITGPTSYCTGAVAITLDAGAGFASYLWSPGGATTQTINVSPSSNTTYTVTVSNGTCSASDTHDVTVATPPTVTITGPTSYCTGAAAITLDAGAGFTSYLWSPGGATTQTINVSPSSNTTYSVTVSNGTCSASDTHDVTVATPPTVTITGPTTYCTGAAAITLDAGAGFVSYLWSPGGATTQTINVSPSSNTTYSVTVSNGTCSASDTHDVTVSAPPSVTVTGPTSYCTGSPAITLDAGAGFASYLWSPGGATTQTINVSPSSNTTYSVTVSNGTCSASDTHDVTVATPPTVTITGPTTYCTGSPAITLDAGAGFTSYLWSPGGATTQTINVSPSSNTTYSVTASNGICSASDTHDVTVSAPPSVTITGPPSYCTGAAAVTLDAGAGFTSYLWSPGGATTQTINVSPSSNTTYSVTVSNGTCSASDTHDVTVSAPPSVTITGPPSYCTGAAAITLDAGAGFTSYLWSPGGATTQTINVSPSSNTTYTVTVSSGTCSASDTHDVTVSAPPSVTITGPTSYCTGSPAITLDAGAGFTSYLWSPGGATTQTINVSPSSNTTYSVSVSNGTCSASDTHDVTVSAPISVTITGPATYCTGSPAITLDAGAGFTSYLWSPGGATTQTINVSPSSNTTYSVTVSNGICSASDTHDVTVGAGPTVDLSASSAVYANGIHNYASVADAGGGATYTWVVTNGSINSGQGTRKIEYTAGASGQVTLGATVAIGAGCPTTATANVPIITRGAGASLYYTVTPCRIIDTRTTGPALASNGVRRVQFSGVCGIPASAYAVAVNVTAVNPSGEGWLTLYPAGVTRPFVSNLNYRLDKTRANNAIVLLSGAGQLDVYNFNFAGGSVQFLIDIVGYFE